MAISFSFIVATSEQRLVRRTVRMLCILRTFYGRVLFPPEENLESFYLAQNMNVAFCVPRGKQIPNLNLMRSTRNSTRRRMIKRDTSKKRQKALQPTIVSSPRRTLARQKTLSVLYKLMTMRVAAFLFVSLATCSEGFAPMRMAPQRARVVVRLSEFDEFLQETGTTSSPVPSRRRIVLGNKQGSRVTVLASSFPAPRAMEEELTDDPFAEESEALSKIHQFEEQRQQPVSIESKLKSMDLQDIIITMIVPGIALFAAGRWGYNRVAGRVTETADATLEAFAKEMLYHDGDFKEMDLCVKDYNKKLLWLPTRKDAMLKTYLEAYAKKKTISPQAIASISYAFTLFQLSESKAADTLVALCKKMGTEKISSAGKLLFLGSRILQSPEGKNALAPIKDLIKSTYRDAQVAETLVETSQQ